MMGFNRSTLLSLLVLSTTTTAITAFSVGGSTREINRRDALAAGLLTVVAPLVGPSPAAALDLSQYKDGPKGIKYLVTTEGSGTVKPQRAQKVKTSYSLYLNGFPDDDDGSNSKKIDSSKGLFGDKPFEFNVGVYQVIPGWDLSLLDMVEGEARKLIIPSDLAYGDKGVGNGKIPGGSTLYFDVQLTEVGAMPEMTEKKLQWLEEHPL